MERVKDHKFLYIQEGVYYFRRTVPQGLRQAFGGKTAVVVSLRDYALAQARRLAHEHLTEFDRTVAAARNAPDPTASITRVAKPAVIPAPEDMESAARAWLKEQLNAGLSYRSSHPPIMMCRDASALVEQWHLAYTK